MSRPDPINDTARDLFGRASERLDQGAAFRLRRARQEAQQPRRRRVPGLVPAGAFASAVLALGLAWWMPASQSPVPGGLEVTGAPVPASEFDTLLSEEDPDLYIWLADAPVATAEGPRP